MKDTQATYLQAMKEAYEEQIRLGLALDGYIAAARTLGVTWTAMGKAMGIEPNAVRQRMLRRARAEAREVA